MVKFLRVLVCALLTIAALVAAAPGASAAPPTAPYAGTAVGDSVALDLNLATGDVSDARFANSESTASSTATPRAVSTSRNLAEPVTGLDIAQQENSQTAPPDNADPETGSFADVNEGGVSTGTINFSNLARWVGDANCVTDGPIVDTTTSTTGVTVSPAGAVDLFGTGDSSTRAVVGLVSTGGAGFNRAVQSQAIGTTSGSSLFGGAVSVDVAGDATLTASADGTPGGADVDYDAPVVTVTALGTSQEIPVGGSRTVDLGAAGAVTVTVNPPATTIDPAGLTASASVAVVTYDIRIGPAVAPLGTATIDQLPLSVSAQVPAGGIDCPPPAPVVETPADGATINDTTPTFSGTGVAGAIVTLTVDGEVVEGTNIVVDDDGTFTFTPTTPLDDGPHTVSAIQTLNGTPSVSSADNEFVIDAIAGAPDAPVITAPEDGSTVGDNTPTITGTGEPGATVTVEVDGDEVGEVTVDGDGNWSLPLTEPLDDGEHTVTAVQTDEAGNTSEADEVTFAVDTEATPPVITAPADGSSTNDTTPTVVGTAEPGADVAVSIDGAAVGTVTADEDGNWSLELTEPLGEGEHIVSAVQTDAAGNVSEPTENEFSVDLTALAPPVITAPEDGSTTDDRTPTIVGTGEPGSTIVVVVDGEPVGSVVVDEDGNWSLTLDDPLADGDHVIEAVAVDEAGNESGADEIEITVDAPAGGGDGGGGDDGGGSDVDGPDLADTGGPGLGYAVVGGLLLVVGGTVLSMTRRRA